MTAAASDVAVVGAGPAGSAAATVLASSGIRVLLLEKETFPRHKVCGEFLSAGATASLRRLGALAAVEAAGPERIDRGRILLPDAREVPFELAAPGLGISRFRLDALLAENARRAGAEIRFGERVVSIEGSLREGFRLRSVDVSGGGGLERSARVVIGAWGRWDALDRSLDRTFLLRSEKFFGWSVDLTGASEKIANEVRLYLFDGGYCGLSRVEDAAVNLAGVISQRARRRLPAGWPAVLEHARRSSPALSRDLEPLQPGPSGFLGTGPVFFTAKPAIEKGVLMVGDAAGVLDPFSGEGQASALACGILAGETVARMFTGALEPRKVALEYRKAWRRRLSRRFVWSALFRGLMLHPRLGAAAARAAGRPLVEIAMRGLAR